MSSNSDCKRVTDALFATTFVSMPAYTVLSSKLFPLRYPCTTFLYGIPAFSSMILMIWHRSASTISDTFLKFFSVITWWEQSLLFCINSRLSLNWDYHKTLYRNSFLTHFAPKVTSAMIPKSIIPNGGRIWYSHVVIRISFFSSGKWERLYFPSNHCLKKPELRSNFFLTTSQVPCTSIEH